MCTDDKLQKSSLCHDLNKKRKMILYIEKYADYIIAMKDLTQYMKRSNQFIPYYSYAKPCKNLNVLKKYDSDVIQIVRFPSHYERKQSDIINPIIERVVEKYGKKVVYINKRVSNHEVLKILEKSHILIDQLSLYYATLSTEAMANGCVVMTRIEDWFLTERPDLPIVSIEKHSIEKKLSYLIENPSKMKTIGRKSIKYYEKYHSPIALGKYLKQQLHLT